MMYLFGYSGKQVHNLHILGSNFIRDKNISLFLLISHAINRDAQKLAWITIIKNNKVKEFGIIDLFLKHWDESMSVNSVKIKK